MLLSTRYHQKRQTLSVLVKKSRSSILLNLLQLKIKLRNPALRNQHKTGFWVLKSLHPLSVPLFYHTSVIKERGIFVPKAKNQNVTGETRAALYIRVSTEEQAMHGLSLAAQRDSLSQYAAEHQMKVVGLYADEGITARKKYRSRTEFMRMLDDVEHGKIDVILFIKLDRWFRNVADYYEIQKILDANNVQWITTEERYDTTTANGRLNLNIKLSIAQDESDRTSERIKFVFEGKRKRGEVTCGNVPLGYRIENKKMVLDEEKAKIAYAIFQKYIDCRSVYGVQMWLIDAYGIRYSSTAVTHMLSNERYIGRAYGQDNFCPAIIDRATFDTVQQIRSQNASKTTRNHRVYLFSGLMVCASCGRRMGVHSHGGNYIYYRCTRNGQVKGCTNRRNTRECKLEEYLLEHIEEDFQSYNLNVERSQVNPPARIDTARLKSKMSKLKDLYLNDLIDRDEYELDYTRLKQELEKASAVQQPIKLIDIRKFQDIRRTYATLGPEHKKAFWSRAIEKIIVDESGNLQIFPANFLLKSV